MASTTGLPRRRTALVAVVGTALLLTGCSAAASPSSSGSPTQSAGSASAAGGSALTGGQSLAGKTIMFQIYTGPDTPFWVPAINGAKAAAQLLGVTLDIEYANADDSTQVNQIQTAIAKKVLGIATGLPNTSTGKAVCAAKAAGIPVVTFNVNSLTGDDAKCVEAFMGQDFVSAGSVIAQRMVDDGLIKQGDKFFCPVEAPTAIYAIQRHQGVMNVLTPLGASCDMVGVGTDPAKAQTTMVQYLLGKPNTTGIIGLGAVGLTEASAAADQVQKPKMPIGGFDLSPTILKDIKSGRIDATVDQQPYSQGFYAVMQLGLQGQYQLYPSNMATGGFGLVDKSNVDQVSSLVPDYR